MLHSWWQKRKGEGDPESTPWPTPNPRRTPAPPGQNPPARPPQPAAASWEEELRRLLQGEEPSGPASPPVVVQSAPPPLPRPAPQALPPLRTVPASRVEVELDAGVGRQMSAMQESAQAFLHGSMPASEVTRHMEQAHPHVAEHRTLNFRKPASPEIRQAVALVRERQSQRAAIIAGIILGPPKAMEV